MTPALRPFHLAFPVENLASARRFYAETLGCHVGRESDRWIDFEFFGHQITAHLVDRIDEAATNPVDGDHVPARHFGIVLGWEDWERLSQRLGQLGVVFTIKPRIRFQGQPGEQATFFVQDPSGNALEFKAFRDDAQIFQT